MADKQLTIKEFKYWLEGVEEMQPEDWIPSKEQWNKIREKINMLMETVQEPVRYAAPSPVYQQPAYHPPVQPPLQAAPSSLSVPTTPVIVPGNLNIQSAPMANGSGAVPVKTPNIDTQNGQPYQSSFL